MFDNSMGLIMSMEATPVRLRLVFFSRLVAGLYDI